MRGQGSDGLCADRSRRVWETLAAFSLAVHEWASEQAGLAGQNLGTNCHTNHGLTLGELISEFLRSRAKAGRSLRYVRALRVSLKSFGKGRGQEPLENITIADVEAWLEGQDWSPRTQMGYLKDVRTMFNFAVKRQMARFNPAAAVELPVQESKPPQVHTPEQVASCLQFARGYNPCICRALAIRYFAGLRSAEVNRLEEAEIKAGHIEVTAAKAKTRQRRLVTIQPNLKAWLELGGKLPLHDLSNTWRWFTAALEKKHGITWPHNVTRHSFVSYHLAQFGSAAQTALQAGHSEQMLFAHYRELVTPAAAAEYWGILPEK